MIFFEVIGIVATLLIIAGFTRTGERQIRRFNIAGAALFVVYGVCINSLSNVLLNSILIIVHLYKLRKKEGEPHCQG